MEVGSSLFEEWDLARRSYRVGPPRQCHNCSENSIFTIGRKLAPTTIVVDGLREWPLLCVTSPWLGCRPPLYPFGSVCTGVNNSRDLVKGALPTCQPSPQFLGSRCDGESLEFLMEGR